ncbi:MAG: hypothetical protein ACK48W_10455 [Bacteroidota bacterium]
MNKKYFNFLFRFFFLFFLIVSVGGCGKKEKQIPTFSGEIANLIYQKCSNCHHQGGPAPFSLVTYQEIKQRDKLIALVVKNGYMPPWPADTTYSRFADEKILKKSQIELIQKWVTNGSPIGDESKLPLTPNYSTGSLLGKPDMVIKMQKAYRIKGNNTDMFLLMKLPYEYPKDTIIKTIEFVPCQTQIVHHVNAQLLSYENGNRKNVFSGEAYVDVDDFPNMLAAYEKMELANDDGTYPLMSQSVCNYLPGVLPFSYPEGIGGIKMKKKGAIFLKDIHYGPSNKDLTDSSYFNIFFAKSPVKRPTYEMQLGTLGISTIEPELKIPANEVKTFKTQITLTGKISLLTVNPHMHLLGKKFLAYAVTKQQDTIPLIRINNWDFRWQYFYTYKKPVIIPQGATIYAFGTFDNTINNPLNPNHPPIEVSEREGSMRTSDEMFQFILTYIPYQLGDENIVLE